jgi:hypothetical protein
MQVRGVQVKTLDKKRLDVLFNRAYKGCRYDFHGWAPWYGSGIGIVYECRYCGDTVTGAELVRQEQERPGATLRSLVEVAFDHGLQVDFKFEKEEQRG